MQIMESILADRRAVLFDGKDTDKPAPRAGARADAQGASAIVDGDRATGTRKRAEALISDHLMRTLATINIWQ